MGNSNKEGYVGNGKQCTGPADECQEGTHTCNTLTTDCVNTYAGFTCKCKEGFFGDPKKVNYLSFVFLDDFENDCSTNDNFFHECRQRINILPFNVFVLKFAIIISRVAGHHSPAPGWKNMLLITTLHIKEISQMASVLSNILKSAQNRFSKDFTVME